MIIGIVLGVVLVGWTPPSGEDGLPERDPGSIVVPWPPIRDRFEMSVPLHLALWDGDDARPDKAEGFLLLSGARLGANPESCCLRRQDRSSPPQERPPPQQERPPQEEHPSPHDFSPSPGSGPGLEEHFSERAWRDYVWEDYLSQPAILIPLGLGVSAAAISHWDRRLESHWHGALGARGYYSDASQYTLIGVVCLIGTLFPGEGRTWWDESWTIGEAFAASSLTTFVLKTGVKRPRPGSDPATGVGTHSFPSGHSTAAFTSATLIERNSGLVLGLPAYAIAGFTAFERVEEGRHYPSDVLAGAAIGIASARIFDALHWGTEGQGGIARPQKKLALEMDGLKGFTLSLGLDF